MEAAEEIAKFPPGLDTCLTIGVFDGVHLGHQHLFAQVKAVAARDGLLPGVVTFDRHPSRVLSSNSGLLTLTSLEEREALIRAQGISLVVVLPFDQELSQLTARQFCDMLCRHLRMCCLVVGPDFALGRNREGSIPVLQDLGQEMGFRVAVVPPFVLGDEVVSSTAIRRALAQGDVVRAARFLGRPFSLRGTVVVGERRGQRLGFPTANLPVNEHRSLPADGVYVARAVLGGQALPAVSYIGPRPTFGPGQRVLETYILDFAGGQLYGRELQVELVEHIRGDMKFPGVEALKEQIARDVETARRAHSK